MIPISTNFDGTSFIAGFDMDPACPREALLVEVGKELDKATAAILRHLVAKGINLLDYQFSVIASLKRKP